MKSNALIILSILLIVCGCVTNPDPGIVPATSKLDVWPNPATLSVMINVTNNGGTGNLKIFDTEGQEFFKQSVFNGENQYQVNLQTSPEGTYHVVVELDHETITTKFIKL